MNTRMMFARAVAGAAIYEMDTVWGDYVQLHF